MDNFDTNIKKITDDLATTVINKNHDYGNSFESTMNNYGNNVLLIRLSDKLNRIESLMSGKDQQVSDESITDTLKDLAGYSILAVELFNRDSPKKQVKAPVSYKRVSRGKNKQPAEKLIYEQTKHRYGIDDVSNWSIR